MAEKSSVSKKPSSVSKKETETKEKRIQIELIPSLEPRLGRAYANYVQISHSPFDFTIRFCEAPSTADIARNEEFEKGVKIPNIVEVNYNRLKAVA
jgi:hypothetical protein